MTHILTSAASQAGMARTPRRTAALRHILSGCALLLVACGGAKSPPADVALAAHLQSYVHAGVTIDLPRTWTCGEGKCQRKAEGVTSQCNLVVGKVGDKETLEDVVKGIQASLDGGMMKGGVTERGGARDRRYLDAAYARPASNSEFAAIGRSVVDGDVSATGFCVASPITDQVLCAKILATLKVAKAAQDAPENVSHGAWTIAIEHLHNDKQLSEEEGHYHVLTYDARDGKPPTFITVAVGADVGELAARMTRGGPPKLERDVTIGGTADPQRVTLKIHADRVLARLRAAELNGRIAVALCFSTGDKADDPKELDAIARSLR